MQISTFFEDIGFGSQSGYLTDILAVREIHDDSFAAHGWHVNHVSLEHARQHPAYADFASMDALYRLSRNKLQYTRICYMRWLAYAQVGADFADLDIINFGFAPSDAAPLRALGMRGPVMLTRSCAMGLAGPGGYDAVISAFYEAARLGEQLAPRVQDVNDMCVLQVLRPELFSSVSPRDPNYAQDYTRPGWDTARLVHFAHHHTPSPRIRTIASAIRHRGSALSDSPLPSEPHQSTQPATVFSIAMPVRGQSEFLPSALASIAVQSAEVNLSVMDATDDDSVQQVLASHSAPIHYSRHGADAGQAAAIKEGWDRSPGDVVGWLCADDCLFPDALAAVAQAFRDHPDADVVYGDAVFIDGQGGFIRHFPSISSDIGRITWDCCIAQPSCFVRRKALDRVGGIRPDLHFIMDWDLWTRLHLAGCRFHYLPQPLSASRMHPGTKTTSNSLERLKEIWRHLAQHNPWRTSVRSMVGVCIAPLVYRELGSVSGESLGRMIRMARAIGGSRTSSRKSTSAAYGLDTGTNLVRERCTIHIPHYSDAAPSHLVVTARPNATLTASLDGIEMRQANSSNPSDAIPPERQAGPPRQRHVFELPTLPNMARHAFRFELWSTDTREWALVDARLACVSRHPAGVAEMQPR